MRLSACPESRPARQSCDLPAPAISGLPPAQDGRMVPEALDVVGHRARSQPYLFASGISSADATTVAVD